MAQLLQKSADLFICTEDKILKYNTTTNEEQVIKIPPIVNLKEEKVTMQNETGTILTSCVSSDGEFFAASTQRKQIVVYNRKFELLKNFVLTRVASKIHFTRGNDILVADKTGDAYLYKLKDEANVPILLLGHLSMLLDILITDCGRYVVTCDRDEKIRVSHFPNAYNIVSFCLGHREFVTNLDLIGDVLISASGDGTVRFWNFLTGEELHSIATDDHIENKETIDGFCKEMDEEKCEVSCLPITNMQVLNGANVYVAISILHCESIQVYFVETISKEGVQCKFLQNIVCGSPPVCFSLSATLYVLLNDRFVVYQLGLHNNRFEVVTGDQLSAFYRRNENIFHKITSTSDVSVLYKRKFDNVQEYLERKKLRLQIK